MFNTFNGESMDQPGMVANLAPSHLNREDVFSLFPFTPVNLFGIAR